MVLSGGIIPTYILYRNMHLLNSFWVYIVPSLANTYGILVCKLFVEGIPMDIMESAQLDGAKDVYKRQLLRSSPKEPQEPTRSRVSAQVLCRMY